MKRLWIFRLYKLLKETGNDKQICSFSNRFIKRNWSGHCIAVRRARLSGLAGLYTKKTTKQFEKEHPTTQNLFSLPENYLTGCDEIKREELKMGIDQN